jgi:CBS domain-containing protein
MKKVHDVMTRNVRSCGLDTNLAEAVELMLENDCGVLPVVDNKGTVSGIITDRDISIAVATRGKLASDITVKEVTPGTVYICAATDDVGKALERMRHVKVHRLPVVNNDGKLIGILSLNDIVLHARENSGKEPPEISYRDVAITLKAVCEHRTPKTLPLEESEMGVSTTGD